MSLTAPGYDPAPPGGLARPWAWVGLGLAGVLLAVCGVSLDGGGLAERPAPWWRLACTLPGYAALFLAWWRLGPRWRHPRLTAILWSLPLLFSLPLHSRDAYAYAAVGWHAARGVDPYVVPLGQAGPAGALVGEHWAQTTTVYPALQVDVFALASRLAGADPYWTTVVLRLPSILALVLLALALPALARRLGVDPRVALWAGALNPVLLVQWVGGVHNDAPMVALAVAALLAAAAIGRRGWLGLVAAGVLLGLAMGFKQSAAPFGLGLVAVAWAARRDDAGEGGPRGWPRLALVAVVPAVASVAVFLLTSWRWGLGWRAATAGSPVEAVSLAPLSWVAAGLRAAGLGQANGLVSAISVALIAAGVAWVWVRLGPRADAVGRPTAFAAAVLAVVCLAGPALQVWYLTWLIPLLPLCGLGGRWRGLWRVGIVALLLLPALQDVLPPPLALLAVAPLAWLLARLASDPDDDTQRPRFDVAPRTGA
ncbi:MAG: polyprenol phosphomannose-dependent alpha 1,6 mannosyltransferase MptB [Arachnia sp.]